MGNIICSCGWKRRVSSCIDADIVVKSISYRCPHCLFSGQFKYVNE